MSADPTTSALPFLHQQITHSLREAILSGQYAEGTRLPPMEELARQWETSYFTIRQAMKPLAQEGLVEHRRRHGTIVKGSRPKLARVGLYYGLNITEMPETTFYRSLYADLRQQLDAREIELPLFIDDRSESEQHLPLPALQQAIEERSIQALIIPVSNLAEAKWLPELPLPKALLGSLKVPWAVRSDHRQGLRLALEQLRQQEVRSVGVIANLPRDFAPTKRETLPWLTILEEEAARAGIATRPEWCLTPERILAPSEMESYGYEAFQTLWNQPHCPPPDALLSTSDVIGRGVLTAILTLRVEVPQQLRVIQWVNAGTSLFTPLPIDRMVLDEQLVAKALLRQIDLQMEGHRTRALPYHYTLLPHTSSHDS